MATSFCPHRAFVESSFWHRSSTIGAPCIPSAVYSTLLVAVYELHRHWSLLLCHIPLSPIFIIAVLAYRIVNLWQTETGYSILFQAQAK